MSAHPRDKAWRLGIALLGTALLSAAVLLVVRNDRSEAFPGMPAEQRAYWEWVSTIAADEGASLDAGLALLIDRPDLNRLYVRLAELCRSADRRGDCRATFSGAAPTTSLAGLYRDAALAQLSDEADGSVWQALAAAPALEPSLARIVVDEIRQAQDFDQLTEIEKSWESLLAADSSLAGASFGLGYAAVLRNEWERATPFLQHAAELRPDDSEPFREFGRMYFYTGDYDRFVEAMETCIANARRAYNIEEEVVNRGNLGLGYLQWKGDLEKAGEMFEEALRQAERLQMGSTMAIGGYRLANVRAQQHRYDEALALIEAAGGRYVQYVPERISELSTLKGQVLKQMYRLTEANEILEDALVSARSHRIVPHEAGALIALADVRTQLGRYDDAHAAADSALAIANQYNVVDVEMAALAVLGELERVSGNLKLAELHFKSGLATAERTKNAARIAEFSRELGVSALSLGDLNGARLYFDQYRDAAESSDLTSADLLYWIGSTYSAYGNYELAIQQFSEAEELAAGRSEVLLGLIKRNRGVAELELGKTHDALIHLRESLVLLDESRLQNYAVMVAIGHALVETAEYEEALTYFDSASTMEDELEWSAIYQYALQGQAIAKWRLGRLDEAERDFREAISVIETMRDSFSDADDRSFFLRDKIDVYRDYATFLRERGNTSEAFHINERARSRTLVDLLYTTQHSRKLDLSNAVDNAIELARQVQAVEDELGQNITLTDASDVESDPYRGARATYLRDARDRGASLIEQNASDIYGSKRLFTFNPLVADSVSSILRDEEAVIVYSMHDDDIASKVDPSVAYIVTTDGVKAVTIQANMDEIAESIRFLRSAIESPSMDSEWQAASKRLFADLIGPVIPELPEHITHLNVVPQGPMHYLPFAALMDESGKYLAENYSTSVVPSASILKLAREGNPRQWSYMLLMGDPDGRLPGARSEVLSIASEAPSRRHALIGDDASKSMFESVASRYDVLHFATHARLDSRAPWSSHLELHGDELTVGEIGRLSIQAYLVTLSACETALASGRVSDIPNGDEWIGFNQAFLAAGTPSVLASLWSIDDHVSSSLMADFYERLAVADKAEALAGVQRAAIANPLTSHPFYWAAFTVIGDPL